MRINSKTYLKTILLSVQILILQLVMVESSVAKHIARVIDIDNADTLQVIGRDADFPYNGNYRITENIDASDFTMSIIAFSGILDGQDKIISNLQCCIIQNLITNGIVKNIIIRNAHIKGVYCSATIAGKLNSHAMISFIRVEDSQIYVPNNGVNYWGNHAGIIAGIMINRAKIKNTISYNCSLFSLDDSAYSGGVVGVTGGNAESVNNIITFCNIATTGHSSSAGGIAGLAMGKSISDNNNVSHSNISTFGDYAHAGLEIGAVYNNVQIKGGMIVDSTAETSGIYSDVAIVIGGGDYFNIKIFDTTAINCSAIATGENSYANIWGVPTKVVIYDSEAVNCIAYPKRPPVVQQTSVITGSTRSWVWVAPWFVVGAIVVLLAGCSIYDGYAHGNRGLALVVYPGICFAKYLCRICYDRSVQPEEVEEISFKVNSDTEQLLH